MTAAEQLAIERQYFQNEARSIKQDHAEGAEYWADQVVESGYSYAVRGDTSLFHSFVDRDAVMQELFDGLSPEQYEERVEAMFSDRLRVAAQREVALRLMNEAFEIERKYLGI